MEGGAQVHGIETGKTNQLVGGVFAYRGIRYANAERFGLPKMYTYPFGTSINASTDDTRCVQQKFSGDLVGVEDCLFLDVYTPGPGEKRAVMVWIHGGGLVRGSKNGQKFLINMAGEGDILAVAINYRLNLFGFLTLDFTEERQKTNALRHPKEGPKNLGVRDQIEALKWVRANIRMFGGDWDRITIAGQSAGALCVLVLYQSPLADSLFHRGIMHSPGFQDSSLFQMPVVHAAATMGRTCLMNAGCHNMKCLRGKSLKELTGSCQDYMKMTAYITLPHQYFSGWDGEVLESSLTAPLCSKMGMRQSDKPIIVGGVLHEWRLFYDRFNMSAVDVVNKFLSEHLTRYNHNGGKLQECAVKKLLAFYNAAEARCRGCLTLENPKLTQLAGDVEFTIGAQLVASTNHDARYYRFLFDVEKGGGLLGSTHDVDLDYYFLDPDNFNTQDIKSLELGYLSRSQSLKGMGEEKRRLGKMFREYLIAFVKEGEPASSIGPKWTPVNPGQSGTPLLRFKLEGRTEMHRHAWFNQGAAELLTEIACDRTAVQTNALGGCDFAAREDMGTLGVMGLGAASFFTGVLCTALAVGIRWQCGWFRKIAMRKFQARRLARSSKIRSSAAIELVDRH